MENEVPNSQAPVPVGNEPASGMESQKPVMGTTPARQQRNQPPAPTANTDDGGKGTEGQQAPATAPQDGQGEPEDKTDYKEKFSNSSREAQRLLDVLKANGIDPETGKPISQAQSTPAEEPTRLAVRGEQPQQPNIPLTDEQLTAAIPGFANLTDSEKALIRDTKSTVKQISELKNLVAELYDEREYNKQFKALVGKEQWKSIAEHAEEFKEYAYKNENLQTPLETLAASFLYTKGLSDKQKEPKPQPTGLEPGSGGGKGEGKTDKDGYTAEEIANIRTTDPKKYAQLAQSGKLKIRG